MICKERVQKQQQKTTKHKHKKTEKKKQKKNKIATKNKQNKTQQQAIIPERYLHHRTDRKTSCLPNYSVLID